MSIESRLPRAWPAACLAALLAACAAPVPLPAPAPAPAPAPVPMRAIVPDVPATGPAVAPLSAASAPAPAVALTGTHPLEMAVAYAERVRTLAAAELAQEVQRLGDSSYSPLRATQLATALGQTRTAGTAARAQTLLQRVIADTSVDAQALQAFARLLSTQIADQRRADEQAERQAQQLREAQRRIEQLNDRLEAVRAIERSLPGPARRDNPR